MNMGLVRVPYFGTIKLLDAFQEQAGISCHKHALKAMLFLNKTMVQDADDGLVYTISCHSDGSRLDISEIYNAHMERAQQKRDRDIMVDLQSVDDVALRDIANFLARRQIECKRPADVLTAAITVARCMYEQYGSGKTGELHIPTIYPNKPVQVMQRHIYLNPS